MSGARLAVKVVVSLSFLRDSHPLHSHQLAWRTVIRHSSGIVTDLAFHDIRHGNLKVRSEFRREAGIQARGELRLERRLEARGQRGDRGAQLSHVLLEIADCDRDPTQSPDQASDKDGGNHDDERVPARARGPEKVRKLFGTVPARVSQTRSR